MVFEASPYGVGTGMYHRLRVNCLRSLDACAAVTVARQQRVAGLSVHLN